MGMRHHLGGVFTVITAPGQRFKLAPGDDPKTIAARLTKEGMRRARESTFNRPLNYRPLGIA